MTAGSWAHTDLSTHMRDCRHCRELQADEKRAAGDIAGFQAARAAMCRVGQAVYTQYLNWLAE